MTRFALYHGSFVAIGASFVASALGEAAVQGPRPSLVVLGIGGLGLFLVGEHELVTGDPSAFSESSGRVSLVVVAALLAFVGTLLRLSTLFGLF